MIEQITLTTPDGDCAMRVATPGRAGRFPAVLFCMDAGGLRPAMDTMMQRIADDGYVVATPDLLHRVGSIYDLIPAGQPRTQAGFFAALMADPEVRKRLMSHYIASALADDHLRQDLGAAIAHLDARADVREGGMGVTGYCMGGNAALRAAILFPDRIAAAASFHGGMLVSDAPDSPHRRVAAIKAEVYVAAGVDDAASAEKYEERLRQAFDEAGVTCTIEIYQGARHGFAVSDHPAYQPWAEERHDRALLALLRRRLT